MLSSNITGHAILKARIRIPIWEGWSEEKIEREIINRLSLSRVVGKEDEIYSLLERGNTPCRDEMVCFMKDDVAVYILKRNIFEKKFRVSTVYNIGKFSRTIKLGTYLEHKGQGMNLIN